MQSNYCTSNVTECCLGAIVIAVVIDSTLGLINCRKKVIRYKNIIAFIRKQLAAFLLVFFYFYPLPDGKINKF